jgi:hypothetical protein
MQICIYWYIAYSVPCVCTLLFLFHFKGITHVKWVLFHHGMARPRFADRGDGLQIWRVAAITWSKQSRAADRGWLSSLVVERGLTTHRKQLYTLRIIYKRFGAGGGPRAGLDTEIRGKILCPRRGSYPDRPVVQPVVRHYTA